MTDLGPEARSVVEAARGADAPSRADRDRIKHRVLMQVATLGAVSTAAGGAVAMSVATKVTLIAVTAVVLGGGSASIWAWKGRAPAPAVAPRTQPAMPSRPAAPPVAPASVVEPAIKPMLPEVRRRDLTRSEPRRSATTAMNESAVAPEPAAAVVPVVKSAAATRPGPRSLDPELAMLRLAQDDLRAGLPAQALRRLAEYDRRFPKGTLDQERRAIQAIAMCQAQPGPSAQAQAERFLRHAPESPLAERVRAACKKSDEASK
jgi:hypothetical protein